MKRILSVCLGVASLAIVLAAATTIAAQPKGKPKPMVAVLPFNVDASTKITVDESGRIVQRLWNEELKRSGKVRILSSKEVDAKSRITEPDTGVGTINVDQSRREPDVLPFRDPNKAKEIGRALGVKYLVTGNVLYDETGTVGHVTGAGKDQKRTYSVTMNAKLIDTSTGQVVWSEEATEQAQITVDESGRIKAAKGCARQLAKKLTAGEWLD